MFLPVKSQPEYILFDCINIIFTFFGWVGVVKSQVTPPLKFTGNPIIETDGLCMPNVQVTIGFWWNSFANDAASATIKPSALSLLSEGSFG